MENQRKYKTPQYLSEPYRLIIFTVDELVLAVAIIYILGFCCGFMMFSLVLTIVLVAVMKRVKGNEGPYFYVHILYWYFSISSRLKATPPSWIREFLG